MKIKFKVTHMQHHPNYPNFEIFFILCKFQFDENMVSTSLFSSK